MGLFNRKKKSGLERRPEDEKDREELLRQLAGAYHARKLTTAQYNAMVEAAERTLTHAQVKTALQGVSTAAGVVGVLGTIAGVAITTSQAPPLVNTDPLDGGHNGESRFADDKYVDGENGQDEYYGENSANTGESRFADDRYFDGEDGHNGYGGDNDVHQVDGDLFDDGGGCGDC